MSEPHTGDGDGDAMEAYAPFADMIEEIGSLTIRSRGKLRQPLVCLLGRSDGASDALAILARSFASPERRRQVPHVLVDTATSADVRDVLVQLTGKLSTGHFGVDQQLHFRHFDFVKWLMDVNLGNGVDPKKVSARKLRAELAVRLRRVSGLRVNMQGPRVLAGWPGFVLWLIATIVPAVIFRVLISGRLPGVGRVFRWVIRQKGGRKQTVDFLTSAVQLTDGVRIDEEKVRRLLVHAFLQDLRVEFRRRPWRVRAWRRTGYPVVMLDQVAPDNCGYELLRLVSAVRDQTDFADPLLIVAAGCEVPSLRAAVPLTGATRALREWRHNCAMKGSEDHAPEWFLGIAMPAVDELKKLPDGLYDRIMPVIIRRPAPWLSHRLVLAALLVVPSLAVGIWLGNLWNADCLPVHFDGRVSAIYEAGQCVGYSDSESQLFGSDEGVKKVQHLIFGQNKNAEESWAIKRDRPYVTLVYFGTLTKPDVQKNEETFAAEREEMEGVAAAQYRANLEAQNDSDAPFLRVLVANAGQEMRSAKKVADMLNSLRQDDLTVTGVLGLVESRTWTSDALMALNDTGLPVVAPTLSADHIGEVSNHYLQIAPPNMDQAQLIFDYTTKILKKKKIFNYFTYGTIGRNDGAVSDLYVKTLREGLKGKFKEEGQYDEVYWGGQELNDVCHDRFDGVVFFGGRYSEFGAFVKQLYQNCSDRLPILIGDDSVNRYMANFQERNIAPTTMPLAYVSKGALAFCGKLHGATDSERKNFLSDVQTVLDRCVPDNVPGARNNVPVGERVGLAYDAVRILLREVHNIAAALRPDGGTQKPWDPNWLTPSQLYIEARGSDTDQQSYLGVTGPIKFDQKGISKEKHLSLLCATNIQKAFHAAGDVPYEIYGSGLGYPTDPAIQSRKCGS